jgi:serine-type D-Ala-D-Ala carboxypeptidase (penicillin-binding protein 5/6)
MTTRKKKYTPRAKLGLAVALLLIGGVAAFVCQRPAPVQNVRSAQTTPSLASKIDTASLPWPSYGEAAIGVAGEGVLAAHGNQTPVPTASVAKVMTALAVLEKMPITPGQQGPTITLTQEDQDLYDYYRLQNGSLAAVSVGEEITEYEALEALLLPSANNIADTLAILAFGSVDAYSDYANELARSLGMTHSDFVDASGFSPATVSTAEDLVKLGEAALQNPVIAEIVAKKSAIIPVAGTVHNTNRLLGTNGINGLKTGNTDQAGGVFIGTCAVTLPNGKTVQVISVVMGAPDIDAALDDSVPILAATSKLLRK